MQPRMECAGRNHDNVAPAIATMGTAARQGAEQMQPVMPPMRITRWLALGWMLLMQFMAAASASEPARYLLSGAPTTAATPMRECEPGTLALLDEIVIPAPPGGWSGAPQAVNVFNVFAGEVMVAVGERRVCGRMHDARTRDSRFRASVGMVAVPRAGSDDPIRVAWQTPVKSHWIPTVRLGAPSPVQQEDTLRLLARAASLAIALALAFSALMGFIGARDRTFVAHVLMCLILLLWQAVLSGLSGYPRPWLPIGDNASWWLVAFSAFSYAALLHGTWSQCGSITQRRLPRRAVRWTIALLVLLGVATPLASPALLGPLWWVIDHLFAVAGTVLVILAILAIRAGERRAVAAIAAIAPLLVLFIPQVSGSRPVVEYRVEMLQLTTTWFLIVMAYTLTNRYGQLRRQRDAMRALADTDALTGLPNRRAGLQRLDTLITRAQQQAMPLSVAFVDIDLFKQINDRHGHDVGDRVLVAVATTLAASVRQRDDVIRIGGEEFLVLLPGVDGRAAVPRMDLVRQRVAELAPLLDVPGLSPTASIGLTSLQPGDLDAAAMLRRADAAMYRAKHAGRNRVMADDDAPPAAVAPAG